MQFSLTEEIGPFDIRYRLIGDCEYWLRAARGGANVDTSLSSCLFRWSMDPLSVRPKQPGWEEFDTLRQAITAVIDPPSLLRWERVTGGGWRARQVEFSYAMTARYPHKWRNFVKTLHAYGVDVRMRDLRLLAPARWRGDASL